MFVRKRKQTRQEIGTDFVFALTFPFTVIESSHIDKLIYFRTNIYRSACCGLCTFKQETNTPANKHVHAAWLVFLHVRFKTKTL